MNIRRILDSSDVECSMNRILAFVFLFFLAAAAQAQRPEETVILTSKKGKLTVVVNQQGRLEVNVPPEQARNFKSAGVVSYNDFGARGDGKADDMNAIAAAHAFANQNQLSVRGENSSVYYISGIERIAIIQTPTDFGSASFIIDDREVTNRNAPVFLIKSEQQRFVPQGISSLKRNQQKLDITFPGTCLVSVTNDAVKHYIRFGPNQDNGSSQTDIFLVNSRGEVDPATPIIWDFDRISEITALPVDVKTLTVKGGIFTTIANQAESKYTYYARNISITRSNVVVDGIEHRVTGEGEQGAPYGGFLNIRNCANVTVKNALLTAHKTYRTIGSAGVPVSMGTYDLSVNKALNISFINCSQTNDINDTSYWGILGSNYCKNLLYDNCAFSRFDAHKGVANATIRNSKLGHMGINAIGSGLFTVENSTIYSQRFINLRSDYGSSWQGELVIRNCHFVPGNGRPVTPVLINGSYSGKHDFGYICYMPERILIENLTIDDSNHPDDYKGPAIFANFNTEITSEAYQEKFPYVKTREVVLRNVSTRSGRAFRMSENPFMFTAVRVRTEP